MNFDCDDLQQQTHNIVLRSLKCKSKIALYKGNLGWLRSRYGSHDQLTEQAIYNVVSKFQNKFTTLLDNPRTNRLRNVRNADNVEAARQRVRDNRNLSV